MWIENKRYCKLAILDTIYFTKQNARIWTYLDNGKRDFMRVYLCVAVRDKK